MSDLSQLQNMPKEPKLGEKKENERKDAEYNTPLNVPLEEQQASLMETLYGVKPKKTQVDKNGNTETAENEGDVNLNTENSKNKGDKNGDIETAKNTGLNSTENPNEKLESNSPYFSILKNLFKAKHIDEATFKETTETLDSKKGEDGLNDFMKIVNNLSNTEVKNDILKSFDNKEKTTEKNFNKTEFFKDSTALNIDLDKGVGGLEIMLADSYISINNVDGTEDKSRDLSSGMDTTLNTILKGSSNDFIKQNGPLISDIRSEKNLNKKYDLLKELYKEDLKRDATLGGKKAKEEINNKKTSLIEQYKDIMKQLDEAKNIVNDEQKNKTINELTEKKDSIIEEGKGIDNFEAEISSLSGGKVDKGSENKEKNKTD